MNHIKRDELVVIATERANDKEYWSKRFSGEIVITRIPYSIKPGPNKPRSRDQLVVDIPHQFSHRFIDLAGESDVRLHIILVSLVGILIHRYTSLNDIVIGFPIIDLESGDPVINYTLPCRIFFQKGITFKELLLQVRKTIEEAIQHQNYPMDVLFEQLKIPTRKKIGTLTDIVVSLDNIHQIKNKISSCDLLYIFKRNKESLHLTIDYRSDLYHRDIIYEISTILSRIMEQVCNNFEIRISEMEIIIKEEKHWLLYELNNTDADFPKGKAVHELFEEMVEKKPYSIATCFLDQNITYEKLNKKANQLGRVLRKKGVAQNAIVALLFERSLDMIISILGILKAGGVYLPIDPDSPTNRVVSILNDADVSLLLSSKSVREEHPYTFIQGIQFLNREIFLTRVRPQIQDINTLPIPDRSLINYEEYNKYISIAMVNHSINMYVSRGCPFKCAYCHKIWPKKHYVRSSDKIFEEILRHYEIGFKDFVFVDDIFNLNNKNSLKFFQSLIKNNLDVQLFFPSGLRGDILTRDYIDLMIEAGTVNLGLALETASARLQKLIGKNLNLEKFEENAMYILKKYPQVVVDFFIMHGFPSETEDEALMTLDFIKRMKWVHFPVLHILKIFPNTEMAKLAKKFGVSNEAINRSKGFSYHEHAETLPFNKKFTLEYQTRFLKEYLLLKERLLSVLPYQMKLFTENELAQKYNTILQTTIRSLDDLLNLVGISRDELSIKHCKKEDNNINKNLNLKLKKYTSAVKPKKDAIKILLLDLSQEFDDGKERLYDVVEMPLGLMSLLTFLNHQFGSQINGRIFKSKIDFNNFIELKNIINRFRPDVIGIRTLSMYQDFCHQTISLIRQWNIKTPIILGGPYATSDYNTVLQDANIDLVVIGEGEHTFAEIIEKMIAHEKKLPGLNVLKDIKGIAYPLEKTKRSGHFYREIIQLNECHHLKTENDTNLESINSLNDMAYVIYTSGTTGKPKGAMIQHKNVVRLMFNDKFQFHFTDDDIWTMFHSYSFDFSVWEMYGALLYGGKLILIDKITARTPKDYIRFLGKEKVTILNMTPTAFYTLLEEELYREQKELTLKYIIFGGEKLTIGKLAGWKEKYPDTKLINMYGITETTVHVTFKEISSLEIKNNRNSIGKPIPTITCYIFDFNKKLLPVGAAGELFVGGEGVVRGYLNNMELSREKFVINPYNPDEILYKSGDLARILNNGEIEYLGRIDNQVKIRGNRIELEEIEKQLLNIDFIKKAVVIEKKDIKGNNFLCAYIITRENYNDQSIDISGVKVALSYYVPDYMIPSFIVRLDKIPLTTNHKIDKQALPEPGFFKGKDYIAPKTDTEKILVEIWSDVLEVDKSVIGIDDNFFDLGGHSLNVTILISKIHKEFNKELSVMEIFQAPTIRDISTLIEVSDWVDKEKVQVEKEEVVVI